MKHQLRNRETGAFDNVSYLIERGVEKYLPVTPGYLPVSQHKEIFQLVCFGVIANGQNSLADGMVKTDAARGNDLLNQLKSELGSNLYDCKTGIEVLL